MTKLKVHEQVEVLLAYLYPYERKLLPVAPIVYGRLWNVWPQIEILFLVCARRKRFVSLVKRFLRELVEFEPPPGTSMVPSSLSVGLSAGSVVSAQDMQNGQAELDDDALLDAEEADTDEGEVDWVFDADSAG